MDPTRTTRVLRHIRAPRALVYRALLDADDVRQWMVPEGMSSHVHVFDTREGGRFRVSLSYDDPGGTGKSDDNTDTFHGRFAKLVHDQEVVQLLEFESPDPAMQGEMRASYRLDDAADGGTDVVGVHEGVPPGIALADNETGWRMSLDKLAALVEARAANAR
jgi:uncharacterized protein YndB with AHSA1/START domain